MQVGDILTGDQLDGLPRGSVVVHDEGGEGFNTVTRAASGYSWYSQSRSSDGHHDYYDLGEIVVGDWTVVHLPAVSLKVGDVVTTEAEADALPVGAVIIDLDDDPHGQATVKTASGLWRYFDERGEAKPVGWVEGPIVHIPARADTGAGSTAA